VGARQTGKSTLFRLIGTPDTILVDLQERSERVRLMRDPEALTRSLVPPGRRPRHVLIDEVQRVPELLDEIQLLLDRYPGRFTFTLTGSSARRLRTREVNLLPGRIHRFHLGPVCSWELTSGSKGAVLGPPRGAVRGTFPGRSLEEILVLGSLPAAFVEGQAFKRTLESYADVYIEEEVLREMAARNLGDYGRFLQLAAIESGKPINLTKVSQESGLALSTIRGFYRTLEDTLLGFTVGPFSRSSRARLLKTPRFFFFDVGVRNAVAGLPLHRGILATEGGRLLEHWVACELYARIGYLGRGYRLSGWRTVDGAEVDFILETPREVIPIEVKYTQSPRPSDARGIEHFLKRHAGLARRGFLVCRTRRAEQLTPHVRAIPWQVL
jgi:predicted AAA+ superfamily ATPase